MKTLKDKSKGLIFWKGYNKYLTCEKCANSKIQELGTLQFDENGDLYCCSCDRTWNIEG